MRAVDILCKKRDGQALDAADIEAFVAGATHGAWPDYQLSALLMAIVLQGMDATETANLTRAMVRSGMTLDLSDIPGPKVDKHSTGGVGDKTTLVAVPLAAACGVIVPKMSGRALGHSGGTLDKLESIPGFRVSLSLDEFRAALRKVGCALAGQTKEIAPADKKLYALRDVTATVESIPLITASIMSKKLAEGIGGLVLDVKCGQGAFMKTWEDARRLAEALVATGKANGVRTEAVVTAMDAPLGRAIGNALEVTEGIETLKGRGPAELTELAVTLAWRMLLLAGLADTPVKAQNMIQNALSSGRGLEKLREVIANQGGHPCVVDEPARLPRAPRQHVLRAERSGFVSEVNAELLGRATMVLGAGRDRADDAIDPSVGVIVQAAVGDSVKPGDALAELHYRDEARLGRALPDLRQAWLVTDGPPSPRALVLDLAS